MPVRPEPEQHEVEALERAELLLVQSSRPLAPELAAHPVDALRLHARQERRSSTMLVVRALVVVGDAALVAEPDVDARSSRARARAAISYASARSSRRSGRCDRPLRATSASRSATTCAGSLATTMSIALATR